MSLILNLETSTKACSVCLALDGQVIDTEEHHSEDFTHSENLTVFIERIVNRSDHSLKDLAAVAFSSGPGSYTGLRIGCSTAKGLCYSLDIPLIAIDSLKALATAMKGAFDLLCPLFDARRMEVYSTVYDNDLNEVEALEAKIIDERSYQNLLVDHSILFAGPGAEKVSEVLKNKNASFDLELAVSAKGMAALSEHKFQSGNFEDTAYFEPNYLKEFIAGTPKKHFQ
jgi:tRNA threonylcarbamoyladenosine biosynthesis protein TsaB